MIDDLKNDFERAEYLQNMLLAKSTGGNAEDYEFGPLRRFFLENPHTSELVPSFIRTNRDLSQFWNFIKTKFATYAERREFIWSEFQPLLDYLEGKESAPSDPIISNGLKSFDETGVHNVWSKAIERREADPEGAITVARTLLESVCKHILDEKGVEYNSKRIELHELYKLTASELKLSPSQHTETIFKQILGGCSAVVNGLGSLRNRLGDAHGQGRLPVKPAPRHAELAVNLAGSVALFLVSTWHAKQND